MTVAQYLKTIERDLAAGQATEHTYRPVLKALIESLSDGITATNEPKRVECGAPDFIVTKGEVPLGYIEAKDVGASLDNAEKSEQLERYRESLGNLILTDGSDAVWRGGTGVPPVNHAQDARATFKLHHYPHRQSGIPLVRQAKSHQGK